MKHRKTVLLLLTIILILLSNIAFADNIVVAFEKREYTILAGKTATIKPVIQGTKSQGKFAYTSTDESIATVKNGQTKGITPGDATINCTVTIGTNTYNCSYIIHVLQPVTQIYVPEKEMSLPAGAILRQLPFSVLPEDAANKEIEVYVNNKKIELPTDGTFHTGYKKYTFKTTDGSN